MPLLQHVHLSLKRGHGKELLCFPGIYFYSDKQEERDTYFYLDSRQISPVELIYGCAINEHSWGGRGRVTVHFGGSQSSRLPSICPKLTFFVRSNFVSNTETHNNVLLHLLENFIFFGSVAYGILGSWSSLVRDSVFLQTLSPLTCLFIAINEFSWQIGHVPKYFRLFTNISSFLS